MNNIAAIRSGPKTFTTNLERRTLASTVKKVVFRGRTTSRHCWNVIKVFGKISMVAFAHFFEVEAAIALMNKKCAH